MTNEYLPYANNIVDNLFLGDFDSAKYLGKAEQEEQDDWAVLTIISPEDIPGLHKSLKNIYSHVSIPLDDAEDEDIYQWFGPSYDYIQNNLDDGKNVLVHCMAGISRSASLVIAYMMKSRNMSFSKALKYVQKKRSIVGPNRGFRNQLLEYEKELEDTRLIEKEKRPEEHQVLSEENVPSKDEENFQFFIPVHPSNTCKKGWVVDDKILGYGAFSNTYVACCGPCEKSTGEFFVAKVMPLNMNREWKTEIIIQNMAAKYGISIPVLDYWKTKDEVILIMPMLKITLYDYFLDLLKKKGGKDKINNFVPKVIALLKELRDLSINHNDTSLWNIMLGYDNKVYIIDFGISTFKDTEITAEQGYERNIKKLRKEVEQLVKHKH